MKKILTLLLSSAVISAFAVDSNDSGFYAGLNLGITSTASYLSIISGIPTTVSSAGLGYKYLCKSYCIFCPHIF